MCLSFIVLGQEKFYVRLSEAKDNKTTKRLMLAYPPVNYMSAAWWNSIPSLGDTEGYEVSRYSIYPDPRPEFPRVLVQLSFFYLYANSFYIPVFLSGRININSEHTFNAPCTNTLKLKTLTMCIIQYLRYIFMCLCGDTTVKFWNVYGSIKFTNEASKWRIVMAQAGFAYWL